MKLILLLLAVSAGLETACTTAPPANSNRPNVNANATAPDTSQTNSPQQAKKSATGSIEVTSTPPGARVLLISVDETGAGEPQSKGLTPATITEVQPGKYTLDLERPGYRFFQKEIEVKAGKAIKVSATLRKQ
jgi:hypothetical protein